MDPANYQEHGLPKITYNIYRKSHYLYNSDFYAEFHSMLEDCVAISCDDEVVYNTIKKLSIRETYIEQQILNSIVSFPEILFMKKPKRTMIYLKDDKFIGIYQINATERFIEYYCKL
jgi:hypothetical protein